MQKGLIMTITNINDVFNELKQLYSLTKEEDLQTRLRIWD